MAPGAPTIAQTKEVERLEEDVVMGGAPMQVSAALRHGPIGGIAETSGLSSVIGGLRQQKDDLANSE